MPPLPVIADVFRVVLRWSNGGLGAHAVNVLNVHTNASGKTAQQVYTCLDAHVTASMWGFVSTGASVITVDILPLDGSSATQSFSTGGVAKWTGTATGETIPQVAEIIKLQTGIRGPSHRGRIYLPFITEAEQVNGGFPLVDVATNQTAWNNFKAAIEGDATTPMHLQVTSYLHGYTHDVTALIVESKTGTQRRRQQRVRAS